jgi:hypothetical protein
MIFWSMNAEAEFTGADVFMGSSKTRK